MNDSRSVSTPAWAAASLDEQWQVDQWGEDEEAMQALAGRRADFAAAARFLALLKADTI